MSKRAAFSYQMNKNIWEAVKDDPPGQFLFGPDFGERVRTAKSLATVSKEIKKDSASTSTNSTPKKAAPPKRALNYNRPTRRPGTSDYYKDQSSFNKKSPPKYTPKKDRK